MILLEPNRTVIQIMKGIFSKELLPDKEKPIPAFVAEIEKAIDLLRDVDSVVARVAVKELEIAANYYNTEHGKIAMRDKNYFPISNLIVEIEHLMDGQWQNDRLFRPSLLKDRDSMGIPSAGEQERFEDLVDAFEQRYGNDLMQRTDFGAKWEYATIALDADGRDAFLSSLEKFAAR